MADDILRGLDGAPLSCGVLTKALCALDGSNAPTVTAVEVVPGTENNFPSSHSAVLNLTCEGSSQRKIFVKKVSALAMGHKPWADRRRTLAYARTEARFYQEFAEEFAARGVSIPRCALIDNRVDVLLGDTEVSAPPAEEPSAEELSNGGALLMLECAEGYEQASPITEEQATKALKGLAGFHAAAWERRELLARIAQRLQRFGGSFALSIRNPKELAQLRNTWERFVEIFEPLEPELFARPSVRALGERLSTWAGWIARQLEARPDSAGATLVHGDFKAMNVFLPRGDSKDAGMLIDFAAAGAGYGMADVAMLLTHSLRPEVLEGGGEGRLVDAYLAALAAARGETAAPFPREVAMRQYRLGVVDYGRFMVSRFWVDASPQLFAQKADKPNTTLPNRDVAAAMRFIERIDAALRTFEEEGRGPALPP